MGLTNQQIAQLVVRIYAATNRSEPTESQLDTWGSAVRNLDWNVALRAAKEVIVTEERAPSIATFLSYVERQVPGTVPSGEEAITEVLRQINAVGHSGMPCWSHPSIGRAVESIGWRDICASENDYWKTQFLKAYANISKRASTSDRIAITSGRLSIDTSALFAIEAAS